MTLPATLAAAGAATASSAYLPKVSAALARRIFPALLSLALPAALLLLWQLASTYGWMPPQILPAPSLVFATLVDLLHTGEITASLLVSLHRIAWGFSIGAAAGFLLGCVLGTSQRARDYLDPTVRALFAVPTLGWIPILILVFGIDETLKTLVIAKAVLVPIVVNTSRGIRNIPDAYVDVARALRLPLRSRFLKLTVPASLPSIFTGIRLGLNHAFIALIVVEMLAATEGLGYMMVWGRKLFQLDIVIVGMIVVGIIGFLLDRVLREVEQSLGRWLPDHG